MFQHSKQVWENPPVSGGALLVLHYLAFRADAHGCSYPGVALMARETAMSERGVQDALRTLRSKGVITITPGGGRNNTNVYTLTIETPQMTATKHPEKPLEEPVKTPQMDVTQSSAPFKETPQMVPETPQMTTQTPQITAVNPAESAPKEPITTKEGKRETPKARGAEFVLPEWVPVGPWKAYEQSRRSSRNAMTDDARRLNVRKLEELKRSGYDPTLVLETAVERGWRGLFPPPVMGRQTTSEPVFEDALEVQRRVERAGGFNAGNRDNRSAAERRRDIGAEGLRETYPQFFGRGADDALDGLDDRHVPKPNGGHSGSKVLEGRLG